MRSSSSISSRAWPAPSATQVSGESARRDGTFVSCSTLSANPRSSAPPPGQHDSALGNVGRKLGGRLFERRNDRGDDLGNSILQRFAHPVARHQDLTRKSGNRVPAFDLGVGIASVRRHAAHLQLDPLGRGLPDREAMRSPQPCGRRVVEVVAPDPQRLRHDDPSERHHRDLARAAADVQDHVRPRFLDREPGSNGGRDRLLDQMDRTRPGGQTRLRQGTLFDVGDARWGAHHHPWAGMAAAVHALHEVTKHLLRHLEVGDHAVPQRPHGGDARRRPADHLLGLLTHRMHGPRDACRRRRPRVPRRRSPRRARRPACSRCRDR